MAVTSEKQQEIQANFEAFKAMLPELMTTHHGKHAVMRHKQIVEFFDTPRDALLYAMRTYPDTIYSIQEVTDRVVDLGWFSYANTYAEVRT